MNRLLLLFVMLASLAHAAAPMPAIEVHGKGFRLAGTTQPFIPWGFNYDHDVRPHVVPPSGGMHGSNHHELFTGSQRFSQNISAPSA